MFVPVFNVDGHERFGAWNRPNQRGPEEMGWRTTAQNYNLNRDYVKADAPEMQAMLRLVDAWDPLAYIDLHVTDGAKFEHDVVDPGRAGARRRRRAAQAAGRAFRDGVIADLAKQGSLPLAFYPSFVRVRRPDLGLRRRRGAAALLHRLFPAAQPLRHAGGDAFVEGLPDPRAHHPQRRRALGAGAGRRARRAMAAHRARPPMRARMLGGQPVPLDYTASDKVRTIDFRGYAYTRTPSEVSGALMTRYDETTAAGLEGAAARRDRAGAAWSTHRAPATSCRPRMRRGSARS